MIFLLSVFEFGVMLNYFHPAFYVDITGIDMIKNKQTRILVWLGGIMAQLIIALPAMVLTFYDKSPLYLNEFMIILNIINTSMMIFNLLFMIKLDGYHILSELIEINRLREKSIDTILGGINIDVDKNIDTRENLIFIIMGIISLVYLPLFIVRLLISGVNRFVPEILPILNITAIVLLIVGALAVIFRRGVKHIRGK